MYVITPYTYQQAQKYNVIIKPSTKKNKKIDIFRNGKLIASVGDVRYSDYPTYLKERGKEYASSRRSLYKKRHSSTRHLIDSPSWWADQLLW